MAKSSTRRYGGVSAETRRAERRGALVEAALDMIGAHGVASLTVSAVSQNTGLNSRYFSESFDSCEDLAVAVYDQQLGILFEGLAAAAQEAPDDLAARTKANVEATLKFLTEDPRRVQLVLDLESTPKLRAMRRSILWQIARIMAFQAEPLLPDGFMERDELVTSSYTLAAGSLDLAVEWLHGNVVFEPEEFSYRIAALLLSTVRGTTEAEQELDELVPKPDGR